MFSSFAAHLATASDTPSIAFAPSLPLFSVPSRFIINLSIDTWSVTSISKISGAITLFTLSTAFNTPFLAYLFGSPSLSSTASCSPVDAPDGTIADPIAPDSAKTVTSTVGLDLESKTSIANTSIILLILFLRYQ